MSKTSELSAFIQDIAAMPLEPALATVVKDHLIDTLGVAIAAASTSHVRSLLRTMRAFAPGGGSTVIGEAQPAPLLEAIQVNAVMAHGIDFDDSHRFVHPGCAIVPTACGLAEVLHRSGSDLLKAILAGYEASIRVSLAAGVAHRERGYHPTGTCNVFGAAGAGAVLGQLDTKLTESALGIAASHAAGLTQYRFEGAHTKHLHAGIAARAGAFAGLLAAEGFTGPPASIEGDLGFLNVLVGERADPEALTRGMGEPFLITRTDFKPYPSCRQTHAPVDLALRFAGGELRAEEIEKVTLHTYAYNDKPWHVSSTPPNSPLEAMLSITFSVAAALSNGRLTLVQFEQDRLADPAVLAIMEKMDCVVDPDITAAWPAKRGARLVVRMRDGRILEDFVRDPSGGDEAPMSSDAIDLKFLGLVSPLRGEAEARGLLARLRNIDETTDCSVDIAMLRGIAA